jgi:hypothetical protein
MSNKGRFERLIVEVLHHGHGCLPSVHLEDPLVEVAMRLSGNGEVSRALELAALWLGQWLPTAKVRAAAGLVLKLTWTISRVA